MNQKFAEPMTPGERDEQFSRATKRKIKNFIFI